MRQKQFFNNLAWLFFIACLISSLQNACATGNEWGGEGDYEENWTPDIPYQKIQKALNNKETVGLRIGVVTDLSSEVGNTAVLAFEGGTFQRNKEFFSEKNHIAIWMNVDGKMYDQKNKFFQEKFKDSFLLVYIGDGTTYSIAKDLRDLLHTILVKNNTSRAVIYCGLRLEAIGFNHKGDPIFYDSEADPINESLFDTKGNRINDPKVMLSFGTIPYSWAMNSLKEKSTLAIIPEQFKSEIEVGADGMSPEQTNAPNGATLWVLKEEYDKLSKDWEKESSEEVKKYKDQMRAMISKQWEPYFEKVEFINTLDTNKPKYANPNWGYLIVTGPKKIL